MAGFFKKIVEKIAYSSKIFWNITIQFTPERIFEEKIAATLQFKNKITGEEHLIDLDVEKYQWYMDDKSSWEDYYLDSLREEKERVGFH